nr:MAG TPA: hypothetical protein [Caudoviricetes sp.]
MTGRGNIACDFPLRFPRRVRGFFIKINAAPQRLFK